VSEEAIPQEVRSLISDHIDSVVQLEILLMLHAKPDADWSAADVSTQLRIDPAWAEGQLAHLCARGLLQCSDQTPRTYRFGPKDPRLITATIELARAYADRRVTIISLIFSKPVDKIQSFADAFRLRKDKSDG
jgi:hypothetical protein